MYNVTYICFMVDHLIPGNHLTGSSLGMTISPIPIQFPIPLFCRVEATDFICLSHLMLGIESSLQGFLHSQGDSTHWNIPWKMKWEV